MAIERNGKFWVYDAQQDDLVELTLDYLNLLQEAALVGGQLRVGCLKLLNKGAQRMNSFGAHWAMMGDPDGPAE